MRILLAFVSACVYHIVVPKYAGTWIEWLVCRLDACQVVVFDVMACKALLKSLAGVWASRQHRLVNRHGIVNP